MASEIKVDTIVNAGGDNDSGIDLSVNDKVAIKTANVERMSVASTGATTITTAGNETTLTLKSTDADGSSGPLLDLTRDSASPADGDVTGIIRFRADNDAGEVTTLAQIVSILNDASDGTEDSELKFETMFNGSIQERLAILRAETVFNDGGSGSFDFRVESDTNSNMLVVNSGDNAVLLGKNTTAIGTTGASFESNFAHITSNNDSPLTLNRLNTDGIMLDIRKNGSSTGTISTNGNSLPSDKNFKRDIKDLNIGLDLVSQLQPKSFNTIVDDENSPVMYGLIAQDLEVALEKVGVTKNSAWILQHEEKNNAKESDYQLDYGKLIPILINAIKELQAKVTALESK